MTGKTASKFVGVAPKDDVSFSIEQLAERWGVGEHVIKRRIRAKEIPVLRLNRKVVRIKLSTILAIEHEAETEKPKGFQSTFPPEHTFNLAEARERKRLKDLARKGATA
jgi:hypothetical protein